MSIRFIVIASAIIFFIAYKTYGRFVSERLGLDDKNITPAHTKNDGIDYVPTKTPVVLGHHFASIAGAGPIVGPVFAVVFGWIPALLWIIFGGIFIGAVHDFTSLVASLRHQGKSIGQVIHDHIGATGKKLFLIFSFSALVLVIGVFADIIAKTFVKVPSSATASLGFIVLALIFGFVSTKLKAPLGLTTVIGVILMYSFVYVGDKVPLTLTYNQWILILFIYVFAASVTPVWILLQPRDYLNSFLLYGMMILGILGIFKYNPQIQMTSMPQFSVEHLGTLFPVLFVTVACGATSGFHSLVASGTTAKQINKETDAKLVGFGGMLIESLLAVVALGTVMILTREDYMIKLKELSPVGLFSQGLGGFISSLGIPENLSVPFVALTVSAFALTTLDTCTRLARYAFQEFFEDRENKAAKTFAKNRYIGTTVTVVAGAFLVYSGGFNALWPVFGSVNQLLAALALLAVSVWLARQNIKNTFTVIPMIFMFTVTLSSLAIFSWKNLMSHQYLLGIISAFLLVLSVILIVLAKRSLSLHLKKENSPLPQSSR